MSSNEYENPISDSTETVARDSSSKNWLLFLMLPLLAIGLSLFVISLRPPVGAELKHKAIGASLPLIDLAPLTGTDKPLDKNSLHGNVVLLNFWGTWCPPCRREFPYLAAIESKFHNEKDFRYVSVSVPGDVNGSIDELRTQTGTFLSENQTTHPTYYDAEGKTHQGLFVLLGDVGYPTTLILDRDGIIRGVWQGYYPGSENKMEQLIRELLASKK